MNLRIMSDGRWFLVNSDSDFSAISYRRKPVDVSQMDCRGGGDAERKVDRYLRLSTLTAVD